MKAAALILLGLLAAWWTLLAVFLIWNYRKRLQASNETPLTAEECEECRRLDERLPRYQMRPIGFVLISPVMLIMLPFYLYGWLVKDPYYKQYKVQGGSADGSKPSRSK